ncbi:MAG: HAMP domain-containing sensor histidine kinase [Spirulinaceae cyanobacterium]
MQLSALPLPEKSPLLDSNVVATFPESLNSFCQGQLELMVNQLPSQAAWIIGRSQSATQKHYLAYWCKETASLNEQNLIYLESEAWLKQLEFLWQDPLRISPSLEICDLVYLFPLLDEQNSSASDQPQLDEYLLIWAEQPLSLDQQEKIQQQAAFIADYLSLSRQCHRQQEQLKLYQQILQQGEHQLRNPLAMIGLYAENLYLRLPEGALRQQAKVVRETVKDLSANLKNLLHCSQQNQLQLSHANFQVILAETIQILEPQLEAKGITLNIPQNALTLTVDSWKIKQVFANILSNAVDFSPVGGMITVNWQLFGKELLVEIVDQGPGLTPEVLKHVFTPFYSQKEGGTGLGLAIAKKNILAHQGSIWVENLPNGGAQFSFTLPRL